MKPLGFEVQEVMDGSLRRPGENFDREFRFDLRVVFPAAEQVHVEGLRDRCARGDLHQLGGLAPPAQPLHEHHRVAAVAVRSEQLRIDETDAHRGLGHRAHPNFR